jgi:hypothetical protein
MPLGWHLGADRYRAIAVRHQSGRLPLADHAIAFGPFRLVPARQLLLEADRPLPIGSRALEILIALVSSSPRAS